jgi:putative ABC transport system permease protein
MFSTLRISARALLRTPSFVILALLMLSTGMGATATVFSAVHTVFIDPLPYFDSEQLVWLRERQAEVPARQISYPTFLDWRERSEAFSEFAAVRNMRLRWTTREEARVLDVGVVTADYFRVFGVRPSIGRDFVASDDVFGAQRVAIVSNRFWEAELRGDPNALQTELVLDEMSFSVVGVLPRDPRLPGNANIWILTGAQASPGSAWLDRSIRWAGFAVARIKPGRTIGEAHAEMIRVQEQLAAEYPRYAAGHDVEVLKLRDVLIGETRLPLLLSFGAVAVLLAMVCVNVSNLLFVRVISRRKEFAIRAALGANRRIIARQVLVESALLVAVGSALGLIIAVWGTRFLGWALSNRLFAGMTIGVNFAVVGYTVALGIVLVIGTSWFPIWRIAAPRVWTGLNAGTRNATGLSQGRGFAVFLIVQTSLSVLLLICAALLASSMSRILSTDPGFDRNGVLTLRLQLPNDYSGPAQLNALYGQVIRGLRAIPGVATVAVLNELPGLEPGWQSDIAPEVDGEVRSTLPGEEINVDWRIVSGDYFETMGIAIRGGRTFTDDEAERGAPVMLVDENLAQRFWPDGDALGNYVRYDGPTPIEIIGIVDNVHVYGVEETGRITIYTPYGRFPFLGEVGVAIRVDGVAPSSLIASARTVIRSIDPGVAIDNIATLEQRLDERIALRTLTTRIILAFASFATLLAAVGLYGVMRYVVGQRRQELGLRIALGAQGLDVAKLVLRRGVLLSLAGILLGVLLAVGVRHLLSSMLFGISAVNPSIYAFVAVLSLSVAIIACAVPAWRAARLDPLIALRAE